MRSGATLSLSDGRAVRLASQLGKGGEGTVFALEGTDQEVAKLYNAPISLEKGAKLLAMTRLKEPNLLKFAAWPIATFGNTPAAVRGFVMPRLTGYRPLHDLYNPASRKQHFPRATFHYLLHAARNLAAAFAAIHDRGCVIGDVNQGNAYVHESRGLISLIDCDSFQISQAGQQWLCEVGVAHFTPPELQDAGTFRARARTPNHDAFGLSVLLFHLLMFGRHPFSGIYKGPAVLLEEAIKRNWFTYSSNAPRIGLRPPPGTPPLQTLGPTLSQLFESSFFPGNPARPSPRQWLVALDAMEKRLKRCEEDGAHVFPGHLTECPWCDVEEKTGVMLFVSRVEVTTAAFSGRFNISVLWAAIEKAQFPAPAAAPDPAKLPEPSPILDPASVGLRNKRLAWRFLAVGIGVALIVAELHLWWAAGIVVWFMWAQSLKAVPDLAPYQAALRKAQADFDAGLELWKQHNSAEAFNRHRASLNSLRTRYLNLPNEYARGQEELKRRGEERQLQRFLEKYTIASAKISNVGDARKATLSSFGIHSAADVTASNLGRVPGFGSKLSDKLVSWRKFHEKRFIFDSKQGVDPNDVAALFRKIDHQRRGLEMQIQAGAQTLIGQAQQVPKQRTLLKPMLERAACELRQAQANLAAAKRA